MENATLVDGRRQRGHDNRARIVAAMLAMIGEGEVSPSAEQVAARADVGLRTVFRHFLDMDSLYREMSGVIEGELRSISDRPLRTQDWPARLFELIERRAIGFEKIAPFQNAPPMRCGTGRNFWRQTARGWPPACARSSIARCRPPSRRIR